MTRVSEDFFDVVLNQRACRYFDAGAPVADDDLALVLRATTHAPSAENTQPWRFVVVRDPAVRAAISALTLELWDGFARDYTAKATESGAAIVEQVDAGVRAGFGSAPVLVVVAVDSGTGVHEHAMPSSIFPCVQNLLLAANALGYGSALTTLTTLVGDRLREAVGLPDHVVPHAVVPIGRPAKPLGPPRRRPVAEVASLDRYGVPFPT